MFFSTALVLVAAILTESFAYGASKSFKLPLRRRRLQQNDLDRRATGEVDLSSAYYGVNWDIDITVGGQNFTFGVDTGSSPLWILSTRLPRAQQQELSSHSFFDPSQSPTFQNMSGVFDVAYDKGENYLSGDVGTDNVTIGGLTVNMPIGVATNVSQHVIGDDADGIFGMAFGTSNQLGRGAPTFMESVISQLDEPVFTFNLPVGDEQSLEFGKIDKSLYTGDLQTVTIQNGTRSQGFGWRAHVSYSMNGKNISEELQATLFDTGGITALANEDVVRNYWAQVSGAQDSSNRQDASNWNFPCDSFLPDLTYNLLGPDGNFVNATVPGRFFNYTALYRQSGGNYDNTCKGGFNSNGQGSGTMGYAFWHAFFTVFNQSAPSVSFAPYPQRELDAVPHVTGTIATGTPTGIPSNLPSSTAVNTARVSYVNPDATAGNAPVATRSSTAGATMVGTQEQNGWKAALVSFLMMIAF